MNVCTGTELDSFARGLSSNGTESGAKPQTLGSKAFAEVGKVALRFSKLISIRLILKIQSRMVFEQLRT
jgi:hypothetical protein